jgi:hypothetical protein
MLDKDGDQPSLGYLDEALGFIAAERARFFASRDAAGGVGAGNRSSTSDSAFHAQASSHEETPEEEVVDISQPGPPRLDAFHFGRRPPHRRHGR